MIHTLQLDGLPKKHQAHGRAHYDDESDVVFLSPALIGMGAKEGLLCAGFDGTPAIRGEEGEGVIFLPAEWLKKERPKYRADVEKAEARVREAIREQQG